MMKLFFLCIFLFCTQLFANKDIKWNLALSVPSTYFPLSSPSYKVAKMVKKMTDGAFIIKIDAQEKLNLKKPILNLIKDKKYEIGHTYSSNTQDMDINTVWFTGVPFGLTLNEQYAWFYYGDGKKYMSKVYDKYNVFAFPGGSLGAQMSGWYKKKILNISDFEGLQVNQTGIISEILLLNKAKIKKIPINKQVNAFSNDKLDVINGISPSLDVKMGFPKIARYYYTSWERPSSQMQFLVNKEAFNLLPKNYQAILTTAIQVVASDMYIENFNESAKAWKKIKNNYPNLEVLSFPSTVLKNLEKSTNSILGQYAKENKLFKEIYQNQQDFKSTVRPWNITSEYNYIKSTIEGF